MTTTVPVDWLIAAALPIVLLVAWVFGAIARWLIDGWISTRNPIASASTGTVRAAAT